MCLDSGCLWLEGGLVNLRPRKMCSSTVLRQINLNSGSVYLHHGFLCFGGVPLIKMRPRKLCSIGVLGRINLYSGSVSLHSGYVTKF